MSRHWAPLSAIIFAAVLAYVVGLRLSESAMAVVIGVMFGVVASIPTSIVLILALRQTHGLWPARHETPAVREERGVIVVIDPKTFRRFGVPGRAVVRAPRGNMREVV